MTVRRTIPVAILATLAIVVAGCTGSIASPGATGSPLPAGSPSSSGAPSHSSGTSTLLLKVTSEGGFINPAANLAAPPTVAVYTDGRILTPGPVAAIYPGPLLPPITVRDVGPSGAGAILAAIRAAGLDKPASGTPGIPGDSGTNVFTAVVEGVTTTSRFSGGQPGQPGGPVASGDDQRGAALALLDRLLDPAETWGAATAAQTPYVPTGYLIFVAPGGPAPDSQASQSPVAWPLATPLVDFGAPAAADRGIAGLRQGTVLGADAAVLGPILQRATTLTAFTSGGSAFTLSVRPLLPDEIGG
jgi:hypothetical protein